MSCCVAEGEFRSKAELCFMFDFLSLRVSDGFFSVT